MISKIEIIAMTLSIVVFATPAFTLDNKMVQPVRNNIIEKITINSWDVLIRKKDINLLFSVHSDSNDKLSFRSERWMDGSVSYKESLDNPFKSSSFNIELPPVVNETVRIGQAFITNFIVHELGHKVMADYANATGTKFNVLTSQDGKFFLGQSTFEEIDEESKLSFSMAGEAAADLTFEHALQDYRKNPTLYNKSLLFFSGTDFLLYCLYAYYLSDGHPHYDPVAISDETGISRDTIFSIAAAKTILNAYRIYSGKDHVIPYFTADRSSAALKFMINF